MNKQINKNIKPQSLSIDLATESFDDYDLSECESLMLRSFNPKSRSLAELPDMPALEGLGIIRTNITDLSGAEKFPNLQMIDLSYCRNLSAFKLPVCFQKTLTELYIDNAKRLTDYEELAQFKSLEKIKLCGCGEINSIKFINELPALTDFVFVDTSVKDGDMSPLLSHTPPLEYAAFSDKRHFSHKLIDVWKELKLYDMISSDLTWKNVSKATKKIGKALADEGKHIIGIKTSKQSNGSVAISINVGNGFKLMETVPAVKYP